MPSRTPEAANRRSLGPAPAEGDVGALNMEWSLAFVRALAEAGVQEAVVSPGSRSAPLALALDRVGIRVQIAIDEHAYVMVAIVDQPERRDGAWRHAEIRHHALG